MRNLVAKKLRSDPQFRMQVRANKKKRTEQRKYRREMDEAHDYEHLDDWLMENTDG